MSDLIRKSDALAALARYRAHTWAASRDVSVQDPIAAIAALPAVTVGVQERVQHKRRGSTYRVLGRGKVQTDTPLTDYSEVVVYQGEADGLVWVRSVTEFEDGRFAAQEPVAAPDPALRPTMTDMMVDPNTLDAFMEANPLPPDPAAIREAALREALKAIDHLPEYGSPDVNIGVGNAYTAILALIQKGTADDR